VAADDPDDVEFRVLTESAPFAIDDEGVISTNTELDYESQKNYILNISLSDGSTADYATVFVRVLDINDNSPVFGTASTTVAIAEYMPVGTSVTSVSATDKDEGFNGLVVYTLKGGEGKMDIDGSGLILLQKVLDREEQGFYNLTVIATLNLTIIVDDVNDNVPVFSSSRYEVKVPEDQEVGSALLTLSATDRDAGVNALVTYRITVQRPQTSSPMFFINSSTGQLSLSQQLDYEAINEFEVQVEASDGGQPSQSTETLVLVHVEDVNDNPPEFSQAAYDVFVFENHQKGSPVYTFSVADKDKVGEQSPRDCSGLCEGSDWKHSCAGWVFPEIPLGQVLHWGPRRHRGPCQAGSGRRRPVQHPCGSCGFSGATQHSCCFGMEYAFQNIFFLSRNMKYLLKNISNQTKSK
uniref:Cadherin domain-containing protein n=1 Tax=Cyanistes caeruleus TaxID=156563 RepID=A0A8C0UQK5_CYACU